MDGAEAASSGAGAQAAAGAAGAAEAAEAVEVSLVLAAPAREHELAVRQLVAPWCRALGASAVEVARLLVEQENLGCLVFLDAEDAASRTLCGVHTFLNVAQYEVLRLALQKQLERVGAAAAPLQEALRARSMALLLTCRLPPGFPASVVQRLYRELARDREWTLGLTDLSAAEAAEQPFYAFDVVLCVAKAFAAEAQSHKRARLARAPRLEFENPELAQFYAHAECACRLRRQSCENGAGERLREYLLFFTISYKSLLALLPEIQ